MMSNSMTDNIKQVTRTKIVESTTCRNLILSFDSNRHSENWMGKNMTRNIDLGYRFNINLALPRRHCQQPPARQRSRWLLISESLTSI